MRIGAGLEFLQIAQAVSVKVSSGIGGIAGTWWSALNAVTESIDHESVVRGATDRDRAENRMMANIGIHGRAAAFKREALELALSMAD